MGLTIPEVTDTLFPFATTAARMAANGSAQAGFATLLETFFAGTKGNDFARGPVGGEAGPLLPVPGMPEDESDAPADPVAALAALSVQLPAPLVTIVTITGTPPPTTGSAPASQTSAETGVVSVPDPSTVRSGAIPGSDTAIPPARMDLPPAHGLRAAVELLTKLNGVLRELIGGLPSLPKMPTPGVKIHDGNIELPGDYQNPGEPEFWGTVPGPDGGAAPPLDSPHAPPPANPPPASGPPTEADPPGAQAANKVPASTPNTERVVRIDGNASERVAGSIGLPRTEADLSPRRNTAAGPGDSPVAQPPAASPPPTAEPAAVDAAAPTPERVAAALPEAVRQLGRAIVERVARGGGETHIRLDPPELGSVTITVRHHGAHVEVDVAVERPDAARLLNDHKGDLSAIFQRHGLELQVQVGVGGDQQARDFREQAAASQRRTTGAPGEFAALMGIDTEAPAIQQRLRAAYNPDGAHVYRI